MWIRYVEGWPRVAVVVAGVLVGAYLIATRQWPVRRRRYRSAWEVPVDGAHDPSSTQGAGASAPWAGAASPPPFEPRPFRRVPQSRTEAVLKGVVVLAALGVLVLLTWMAAMFLTNLPGWS